MKIKRENRQPEDYIMRGLVYALHEQKLVLKILKKLVVHHMLIAYLL